MRRARRAHLRWKRHPIALRVERVLLGRLVSAVALLLDRRLRKLRRLAPAHEIQREPPAEDGAEAREGDRDPARGAGGGSGGRSDDAR